MREPHVGNGAVRGLKLLDQRPVLVLPHQVRRDEARRPVDLCDLVSEHVAVVVVRRHPKASASPTDDLHGGGVRDEVRKLVGSVVQQALVQELLLVVLVEHRLHLLPERLLPLEDRLLGHHVRRHLMLEAAREENVGEILHVIERVVVRDNGVGLVVELPGVDYLGRAVLGRENRVEDARADGVVACAVLATHCMPLEDDAVLEPQLQTLDVDGVSADRDPVPTPAHGAVG
mmetsp:Transcript_18573/g.44647  ORF Transcript_18573/g.44647 Transcript_18573/m.44647 type:complete len:231 (+) Transcript_18573:574-1266(+)